jgi:hypothetical protein
MTMAMERKRKEGVMDGGSYEVNVRSLEVLQRALHRCVYILRAVATKIAVLDTLDMSSLAPRKFSRNHHLIAIASCLQPLAQPLLGLVVLVVNGRIDEVAALAVEVVENLKGRLLAAFA